MDNIEDFYDMCYADIREGRSQNGCNVRFCNVLILNYEMAKACQNPCI